MNESLSRQEIVEIGQKARLAKIKDVMELKDKGYSNVAIGQKLGINESSVRVLLIVDRLVKTLRNEVASKGVVDVGKGAEKNLGVTRAKLNDALVILKDEGYSVMYAVFTQLGKRVTVKVLALPGITYKDVVERGRPDGVGIR